MLSNLVHRMLDTETREESGPRRGRDTGRAGARRGRDARRAARGAAAGPGAPPPAAAVTTDVHQHLWPPAFLAALRRRPRPPRLDDWTLHLPASSRARSIRATTTSRRGGPRRRPTASSACSWRPRRRSGSTASTPRSRRSSRPCGWRARSRSRALPGLGGRRRGGAGRRRADARAGPRGGRARGRGRRARRARRARPARAAARRLEERGAALLVHPGPAGSADAAEPARAGGHPSSPTSRSSTRRGGRG